MTHTEDTGPGTTLEYALGALERAYPYLVETIREELRLRAATLEVLREQRDEARAHAKALARAYTVDSRPPGDVVDAALRYPVNGGGE